jgi:hypothetical protein
MLLGSGDLAVAAADVISPTYVTGSRAHWQLLQWQQLSLLSL